MTRWLVLVVVVVVVLAIVIGMSLGGTTTVQAGRAKQGVMRAFVEERGKTRLPQTYRITMPADGRLAAITLKEGDRVTAGQVVAKLTPEDLQLAVDAGRARVAQLAAQIAEQDDNSLEDTALTGVNKELIAYDRMLEAANEQTKSTQALVDFTKWNRERLEKLETGGTAAATEVREAVYRDVDAEIKNQTSVLTLRAMEVLREVWHLMPTMIEQWVAKKKLGRAVLEKQKASAEAELAQLELAQQRGTMISPVDGIVLRRDVSNERVLSAGMLLLEIGRLEDLEVEVDVLTQDAVRIRAGQRVDVFGTASGASPARGIVDRVYPEGFKKVSSLGVEQQRVKVIVRFEDGELARLRDAGHELGSAFRVRVRIYTDEAPDAVMVPRSALFRGADGKWRVFVIRGGRADLTEVEPGLSNDQRIAITKGVAADDLVILAPAPGLKKGTRVEANVLEYETE